MRVLASIISKPILAFLYLFVGILLAIYIVDIFHDIFVNGRIFVLLIMVFAYPIMILFLYYAGLAAMIPLRLATADESRLPHQILGLFLAPVGLLVGFLLWQAQNWFMFGLLDIEPWLYNTAFRPLGLEV